VQQPQPGQLSGDLLAGVGGRAELGEHRERRAMKDPAGMRGAVVQTGEALTDPGTAAVRYRGALDSR
jgi:hypothetical protein